MTQLKAWLLTIFVIIVLIAGLAFIKVSQIMAAIEFGNSFPEPSETVEAVVTEWSSFRPTLNVVGEIKPLQTAGIRNEVEGIITELALPSGGIVNKGDVLMQFNIDLEQAQLDAINAEIELAKLDVKRFTDLLDVRASSKEQLDRAKAQLAIAQARARGIEASIDKKTIIAPFSGQTSIHDWQVGTYVAANSTIVNIVGLSSDVWLDFNLPQIYAKINMGDTVKLVVPSISNETLQAEVVAINQQFNPSSRTLQVRAKVEAPPPFLRPGVIVSVDVASGNDIDVISIPNIAIRYDTFGSFVFVLEKDEKGELRAKRTAVTVVSQKADISFISKGLKSGQLVASVGSAKLSEDMLTYVKAQSGE